jgi:hypothetical protein
MDLIVFQYLYGGFDAWPINTEFLGDDRAIFRVGVHSVVFTILQSERNFFLEKGLLLFQAYVLLK